MMTFDIDICQVTERNIGKNINMEKDMSPLFIQHFFKESNFKMKYGNYLK